MAEVKAKRARRTGQRIAPNGNAGAKARSPARKKGRAANSSTAPLSKDALRLSQEVLRHLPSGIVFFDGKGKVEEANPSARAALGYTHPQGMTLATLLRDAELFDSDGSCLGAAAELLADTYRTNRILQRKTIRYTTPDGQGRRLGVTLFPLRERETTTGLICLLTDLTAIHALEEELQRRRNLAALGEMAAGIAHEFKNALATISGYGQMLQAQLGGAPRAHVEKIMEQATMLNNIATEFLTFARPLAVQPEKVDLGILLRQCADALRVQDYAASQADPARIQVVLDFFFPVVAGDPVLLTAAFMNLLRNACEAILLSGQGRRISVHFGGYQGQNVQLLFTDDGPGVPAGVVEKIFIPFFTTKASGTGLGLSMVHKIITAHQGSVLLTDAAPGHTVFTVLLPAGKPSGPGR